jgi:hypothetical protein
MELIGIEPITSRVQTERSPLSDRPEATDGNRTRTPFLTKKVRYHFATAAELQRVLGGDRTLSTRFTAWSPYHEQRAP